MINQHKKVHDEIKRRGIVSTKDNSFVKWFSDNAFAGKAALAKTRLSSIMSDMAAKNYLEVKAIRNGRDWYKEYFIKE